MFVDKTCDVEATAAAAPSGEWPRVDPHWPCLVRSELAATGLAFLANQVSSQTALTIQQLLDNGDNETSAGEAP